MKQLMKNPIMNLKAILLAVGMSLLFAEDIQAQGDHIDADITKYRKGDLIIRAKPGDKIKIEQVSHEFWFGCAISNGLVGSNWTNEQKQKYKDHFLKNFNSAVTENAVKWASMEPEKGKVNYSVVDGILAWTEENKIPLRGHNLFWGIEKFVQPWVKELSDEELRKTMHERAIRITSKYKGRFAEYDLNNEMIHGNYYEERLGPGITKQMAGWALEGDPDASLWLNDYDILTGKRLADYMAHIRALLAQDVPLKGIGVQGHLHGDSFDRAELRRSLDSLAVFGLPIRVTEFNVPGQRSRYYKENIRTMTAAEEEQKARDLVEYYRICFSHPAVTGILMWGFWEGANWIPVSSLYKMDWTPTPAAIAYHDLIYKKWWTEYSGNADRDGAMKTRAFFGTYRVTINNETRLIEHRREAGQTIVDFRRR